MLDDNDRRMIQKRRRSLRHLPGAVWLFPLIWLLASAWTWVRFPLLCNPWALHGHLSRGDLSRSTVDTLAAMAPVLVLLLQIVVIAFIWMGIRMLRRERRLIHLLEEAVGKDALIPSSPTPHPTQRPGSGQA